MSPTKVKLVPPSLTSGSRGRWVTTKTGLWNGGSSPHGSSPWSNILRPITKAPIASKDLASSSSSGPVSPPSNPCAFRQLLSRTTHS